MDRLHGKVAVITGGGGGIGAACARMFVAAGAKVGVVEKDEALGLASTQAAESLSPDSAVFAQCDVTRESDVENAFGVVREAFGKVNVIVNCAGGSIPEDGPVTEVDLDVWDRTIDLDLKGTFFSCRYGIPHLIEAGGGSVVNFTSLAALKGVFRSHVYTAAKGGIVSFTQAIAGRYARKGIRANAIAPGVVLTDRVIELFGMDASLSKEEQLEAAQSTGGMMDSRYPNGVGFPEDIAAVALFLASDESRMVNAAVIPAEGGASHY